MHFFPRNPDSYSIAFWVCGKRIEGRKEKYISPSRGGGKTKNGRGIDREERKQKRAEGGTDVLSGGDEGPGTDCTCSVILVS